MVRRYDDGQIVGDRDPMPTFEEWLASELDYAWGLVYSKEKKRYLDPCSSVYARLGTLREVQYRLAEESK